MNILHTESSPGWGGQEIRILKEAEGMRAKGHNVIFLIQKGGGLVEPAKKAGFIVYECQFKKRNLFQILALLMRILFKHQIQIVNTHSSLDAWLGGIAGKLCFRAVVRTRHLSTPIRPGLNSRLLYNVLADIVVTTCKAVVETICFQAHLSNRRCRSIPTGVDPQLVVSEKDKVDQFRKEWGIQPTDILAGTLCVMRGWKGISDLLQAAKRLEHIDHLKWLVIGGGVSEEHFKQECKDLKLEEKVIFTGHLSPPFEALAALDIFLLLSWAHEGVSQASLQAAWLKKPLITTSIGGLPEVCIDRYTGLIVPPRCSEEVAKAVSTLLDNAQLRKEMGERARQLVAEHFTFSQTIENMEEVYKEAIGQTCP